MSSKDIVFLEPWRRFSVRAGFTTRRFPLFLQKTEDLLELSKQNELQNGLSKIAVERFIFLNQVHGGNIAVLEDRVADAASFIRIPEADGVITNIPKTALLVLTADCLSIFFHANNWIGLVHAGWRGTKEKIAQKTFILLMQKARCAAKDIRIALGSAIGVKNYEVGEEFEKYFPAVGVIHELPLQRIRGKLHFDLTAENKHQLIEAGADPKKVLDLRLDTFSDSKNFYSFRRDKEKAGRMISFIAL